MIYADTSFIASIYGLDANTDTARAFITRHKPALPFVFLHWPELTKFLWTSHAEAAPKIWDLITEDLAERRKLYPHEANTDAVARRAAGLLRHYCPRWKKLRSLDALHVALAADGNFKTFVSFDTGSYQRVLAATQKLQVWPPLTDPEKRQLK